MYAIYHCEHCEFTGKKDDVKKHETECPINVNKKTCYTCKYRKGFTFLGRFKCQKGTELPENSFMKYCSNWELSEKNGKEVSDPFELYFG